jgi:tRNA(fMet)-specific endonuclease VapC
MKYMLDTDICIAIIRQGSSRLVEKVTSTSIGEVGLSVITVAELQFGVERSQRREQNQDALLQFLLPFEIAEFDSKAALEYGRIRAEFEGNGLSIGPYDLLIASHAYSLGAVLVTGNVNEFGRVKGLNVENWI